MSQSTLIAAKNVTKSLKLAATFSPNSAALPSLAATNN